MLVRLGHGRCPLRSRAGRSDGGFAAVELIAGTVVAAVMFVAIAGTLTSGQDRERDLEDVAASQEELQSAMGSVLKDVRAAEPLWFETATMPEQHLGMLRLDPASAGGAQVRVRWRIETPAGGPSAMVREVVQLDPVTQAVTSATETFRLEGLDDSIPPFAYFTRTDSQISSTTFGPYTECASRVMVTLRAAPSRGRHPVTLISQAELRNRGGPPWWCP